jgi:glycosyltransferase involved in cell wall biosynthesis
MAVYNGVQFLSEAVESVLAQSYTDFELIISDDGSTDGTLELARSLEQQHLQRIRVIAGERNQGKAAALNRALPIRRGELIAWLDGDDVMLPDKLARQVAALDANPQAVGCAHDAEMFDSDSGAVIGPFSLLANGGPLRSGGIEMLFDPTYKMLPSAIMFRAQACPAHGFNEQLTFTNDWLFDIEVFRQGNCVAINEILVRYRRHGDNFTTRAAESGVAYEEGLMTMAIVTARYPELHRLASTVSAAIMLGRARRLVAARQWHNAVVCATAAYATAGLTGLMRIARALAASARRRRSTGDEYSQADRPGSV